MNCTRCIGNLGKLGLMALVLVLGFPVIASASWLGYRNDTRAAIVVQTAVNVNGRIIRGKAHMLYPGEVAWDNVPAPGALQIAIHDPSAANKLVYAENVAVQNQDIFVSVQLQQPPAVPGKAAPPPQIRLIPAKAPTTPGGQQTPAPKANPAPKGSVPPKGSLPPTSKGKEEPKTSNPKDKAKGADKGAAPNDNGKTDTPPKSDIPPKGAAPPSSTPKEKAPPAIAPKSEVPAKSPLPPTSDPQPKSGEGPKEKSGAP